MGVWWHALAFVTHERAKMSHKPGRNVTQAGPKCHTRAKMSHSHVIINDILSNHCDPTHCSNLADTVLYFLNLQFDLQYIPRNMHTVFALLCFVVVIHWLIFPYPPSLLHWHCGNLTIAPVPAKQPWWIWINTSCEFIMNDCITTTTQSTTKPCAYFLGYTVHYHIKIIPKKLCTNQTINPGESFSNSK